MKTIIGIKMIILSVHLKEITILPDPRLGCDRAARCEYYFTQKGLTRTELRDTKSRVKTEPGLQYLWRIKSTKKLDNKLRLERTAS